MWLSDKLNVENLLMNGRKLVDDATRKYFSTRISLSWRRPKQSIGRFRARLRLFPPYTSVKSKLPTVTVHRYEQKIAGRTYHIEVSPVSASKWRAQIARRPGMPTSLMPFYGQTPDEAAGELSKWLSLVSTPATANT
jgi:hypothetical protein